MRKENIVLTALMLFFILALYGGAKLSEKNIRYENEKKEIIFESIRSLENNYHNIESELDDLKSRIDDIEGNTDNSYNNTDYKNELEWRLDNQQDDIDRLENEKNNLKRDLEDLEDNN